MKLKPQHVLLYILCILASGLILLNRFTPLYINNSLIHFIVLFTAAATFVVAIGINWFNMIKRKSILFAFAIVFIVCFLKAFFTWGGDWKSQTVLYEKPNDRAMTIDFQMRGDRFAFGYKKRVVKRERILFFLDRITDVDTSKLDARQWKRIDRELNEMHFALKSLNVK